MQTIVPRKIKGFRDIDPHLNAIRWQIINAAKEIYTKYGFQHWDTPVLEYADNLGKYLPDTDQVAEGVYSFKNPEIEPLLDAKGQEVRDQGNNVVMANHYITLRYDLTAPLARVYAENNWLKHIHGQLKEGKAPLFRRFQFGPVYRFEAKLDPGRFREFWQIDFDTVGTSDVAADAEVCMVLAEALENIGIKRGTYIIKVNNRKILKGLLLSLGINNDEDDKNIMRIIDKVDKIGMEGVRLELGKGRTDEKSGAFINGLNLKPDIIDAIIRFLSDFNDKSSRKNTLDKLRQKVDNKIFIEGCDELERIDAILETLGFDEQRVIFDPSLIRGMAYYTGPVFEVESLLTYKDAKKRTRKVGAICGGGRYDGLVKQFLGINVPATGASIGIDRLAELLVLTNEVNNKVQGPVLIVNFDDNLMTEYQSIAYELRKNGIETEVYYGQRRNLKQQLSYADDKNSPVAILIGEDEYNKGVASVRNLKLGKEIADTIKDKNEWKKRVQKEVKRTELIEYVVNLLK